MQTEGGSTELFACGRTNLVLLSYLLKRRTAALDAAGAVPLLHAAILHNNRPAVDLFASKHSSSLGLESKVS